MSSIGKTSITKTLEWGMYIFDQQDVIENQVLTYRKANE